MYSMILFDLLIYIHKNCLSIYRIQYKGNLITSIIYIDDCNRIKHLTFTLCDISYKLVLKTVFLLL